MRPEGPVTVQWSEYDGDICYARLGGAVRAGIVIVRDKGKYWFVGPDRLGGIQRVPADSLTDALHFCAEVLGEDGKIPDDLEVEEGC